MNFFKSSLISILSLGFLFSGFGALSFAAYSKSNFVEGKDVLWKIIFHKVTHRSSSSEVNESSLNSFYMARLLTNDEYNSETKRAADEDNSLFVDIKYSVDQKAAWKILIDFEFKTLNQLKESLKEKESELKKVFSPKTIAEINNKLSSAN